MQRSSTRGGSKPSASKKGYRNKAAQLEVAVRDKVNCLARLQSEAVFLRQKGSVLEQLLEVASEVAVHKRQHTGTKFPDLSDPQLLEFLEKFLDSYGGFAAERPTAHNYFNLQRLDVEQYKDVRRDEFVEKYTSLVQRLSLLLLQATDDSLQGGLTTTMDDLKQLLLGTLLWSPITFMQVGTQNLQTGDEVMVDPSHSDQAITGIQLTPEQEDVLVIIGELYNNQVANLEATHSSLSQVLDAQLTSGGEAGAGSVASAIMHVSSNMHRLLAVHQLFHFAIMHNLLDQQLAHLCVRCFPRFPCLQDLLNALARIRDGRGKGGRDAQEAAGHSAGSRGLSLGINLGHGAAGAASKARPPVVETSVLSRGLLAEAGSKLLQSSSSLLSNSSGAAGSGAGVKEEAKSVGGGGEAAEQQAGGDAAAAAVATAEQVLPRSPLSDLADVIKSSGKDWDVAEIGALTPIKPDRSGTGAAATAAAAPGSGSKRPRSPTPAAAGGSNRISSGGASKPGKKASTAGEAAAAAGYASGSSSVQPGNKRARASDSDSKWAQQQQQGGHRQEQGNGIDVNMAIVAAAAAAGMPVDPAAAAALPVPLDGLPVPAAAAAAPVQQPQRPASGVQQSALPAIQQLAAYLNAAQGPQDMMQLLASQPKLALLLQQQPELLRALQEAMAQQQQQQAAAAAAQQAGMPDFAAAAASGAAALQSLQQQHQQHGYAASVSRASAADGLQAAGGAGQGRSNDMPTLEMLPPSLMAKDEPRSSPMQSLLQSLSTLLQACTSVPEAAAAALDMGPGQGDFVLSAVSAAEAACTTALRGLADIKARVTGSRAAAFHSSSAAAPGVQAGAAGGFAAVSMPASSSGRLQPPAGIPMPAGLQASQPMLPQSLSLGLSGAMHTAEAPPGAQANAALLASLGISQGMTQQQQGRVAGGGRQQGFAAPARPGAPASSNALGSTGREPAAAATAAAAAPQQPLSFSALVQQLTAVGDSPSALAQLVQIMQSQQQLTPEVSALLAQLAGAHQQSASQPAAPVADAAPVAEAPVSGVAALMQQIQKQAAGHAAAGMKQVAASSGAQDAAAGWGAGARQGAQQGLPVYSLPTSMAAPAAVSQGLTAAIDPAAAAAAAPVGPLPASAAAAAAAAAGGAGAKRGTGDAKEDSPSAGSSTTNTGQSGRPQQDGADAAAQAAQVQPSPADQQQQQLEVLARAAAAAMGGQLHAPGQAEQFIANVMQLLQAQVGTDGASASMGAVAGALQAMPATSAAGFEGPQQPQPVHPAAAAAAAAAVMPQPAPLGQSAAAAATMIPPAAAAAMAAKTAAAAAAAGSAGGARQPSSDFADMEVDAVSALQMLAAAAVAEGPQHKRGGGRDR